VRGGKMTDVDLDDLYALPLERFVPERNARARDLRLQGRRDEAAEVAALRKPSVAARAVNLLARERAGEVRALLAAGDDLIAVQSRVVAGQADGRALAQAAERERAAASDLVHAARDLLSAEGQQPSATVLERVSETLHAAALDVNARAPVQQGRLERELRHVGFWTGAAEGPASPPARATTASTQIKPRKDEKAAAQRLAQARKRAHAAVIDARRAVQRSAKAVTSAQRTHSRAAEALEQARRNLRTAEEGLAAARDDAEAAGDALATAERELDALTGPQAPS
jgi:hypothetical protein